MSQSQRKAREFREATEKARLACVRASVMLAEVLMAEEDGQIVEAAQSLGMADLTASEIEGCIAVAADLLRGRRDKSAKKPTDANPVPGFTSTARGEKVYRTIPADAKRTPQESEEERA